MMLFTFMACLIAFADVGSVARLELGPVPVLRVSQPGADQQT